MHDVCIAAIFSVIVFAPSYFASARASRMPSATLPDLSAAKLRHLTTDAFAI